MTTLKNTIVLITGATSGIGEATAKAFAELGARVVITGRRKERLNALTQTLEQAGAAAVLPLILDVRNRTEVEQAIAGLPESWQAIEVLVNNAGLSRGLDKVQDAKIEDWEEMIDTNVKGLLYVTRSVLSGMVTRNSGHIINLGSTAAEMVYPGGNIYCASKAAVASFNDGLRVDVLGKQIRVTLINPGMVKTEFSEVRFPGDPERAAKVYEGIDPLYPEDVAETIVWAATRPAHVNIGRITLTCTAQANSLLNVRR